MLDDNIPYVIAEYKIICRTSKIVDYDFVFMLVTSFLPITPSLICKIAAIMRAKAVKTKRPGIDPANKWQINQCRVSDPETRPHFKPWEGYDRESYSSQV